MSSAWRTLLVFAAGIVVASAFHLSLDGVIRDEYQLADSALRTWTWLPLGSG